VDFEKPPGHPQGEKKIKKELTGQIAEERTMALTGEKIKRNAVP